MDKIMTGIFPPYKKKPKYWRLVHELGKKELHEIWKYEDSVNFSTRPLKVVQ